MSILTFPSPASTKTHHLSRGLLQVHYEYLCHNSKSASWVSCLESSANSWYPKLTFEMTQKCYRLSKLLGWIQSQVYQPYTQRCKAVFVWTDLQRLQVRTISCKKPLVKSSSHIKASGFLLQHLNPRFLTSLTSFSGGQLSTRQLLSICRIYSCRTIGPVPCMRR